jgi:hypothetical protein
LGQTRCREEDGRRDETESENKEGEPRLLA